MSFEFSRTSKPKTATNIAEKYYGVYNDLNNANSAWAKRGVLVRAFLKKMMPFLLSQRKARIALEMLDITKNKHKVPDWKEKLRSLGKHFERTSN